VYKLLVLYPPPDDPEHFRSYYVNTHIPLVEKLPGLRRARYSMDVRGLGGESPYFCVGEFEFDSAKALEAALNSEEGKATVGDVPNYATGGITLLHYELPK
jgi:uncharacterized protein (TIGR02118 family)